MNFANENQLENYFKTLPRPSNSMIWYQLNANGFAKSGSGVSLERQIPGFMTNDVEGRDALSTNITELSYQHRDGATYRSKKSLSRDITISYTIVSSDEESHRKKLRKLRSILLGTEHEQGIMRFKDEPDVFYIGTVKQLDEAKFVRNFASNGTIQIHCSDPFKYSWKLYKVKPVMEDGKLQFKVNYKGTYPSAPKFVVKHSDKQENGYIAFTDENSHIVQLGDPSEKDGYSYKATAEVIVYEDFEKAGKLSHNGWHHHIFTAPTANTASAHPIVEDGTFYKYYTEFARTENSKIPDGSGLWLKTPGTIQQARVKEKTTSASILDLGNMTAAGRSEFTKLVDAWHGPSMFHGFYDGRIRPLHATNSPVKDVHLDMKYVFGKQTNGKENMQAGYEVILFGYDSSKPFQESGQSGTGYDPGFRWGHSLALATDNEGTALYTNSDRYTEPNITKTIPPETPGGQSETTFKQYIAYPLIRIAIWNTSPNNTNAKAWIQVNQKHKQTIKFDCKMPLELKTPKKNADGWVQVTGGWRYYKNGKYLTGWNKLKDSHGTFWFYLDQNGYALSGAHELKWSKGTNHFYFNNRCEMVANKTISVELVINGQRATYTIHLNKDGVCTNWPVPDGYNPAKKTGWIGSGKMWRYYVKKTVEGQDVYKYVTGWHKLKWSKGTSWFYFGPGGYMLYGWNKLKYSSGKRTGTFYFDTNGAMVTGTKKINGKVYTFASNGVLTAGPNIEMTQSATGKILPQKGTIEAANDEIAPTDVYQKMTMSTLTIEKYQNKVSVTVNGKTYTYTNALPDTVIFTGVGVQEYVLGAHGKFTYTQDRINKGTPIGVQYIDELVVKQLTTKWKDSKNVFAKGSDVTVNCATGSIFYNGKRKTSLGALGNDYDTLVLTPSYTGEKSQRIQCLYSKWVTNANRPDFEMQYREVFL